MIIAEIMSKKVVTVSPEDDLSTLQDIFNEVSFRHLLVSSQGKLAGVISDRDVLKHLSPFLGTTEERENDRQQLSLKVSDIMTKDSITVDNETLIDAASILLLEHNISCLPVVDIDNNIEGIVSWKDILDYHVYGVDDTLDT